MPITNLSLPPGTLVQVVTAATTVEGSGSTTIPIDASAPQITEGNEIVNVSISPKNVSNRLHILFTGVLAGSVAQTGSIALFQDSGPSAILAASLPFEAAKTNIAVLSHNVLASQTDSIQFRVFAGLSTNTVYWNQDIYSAKFGTAGDAGCRLTVMEYVP